VGKPTEVKCIVAKKTKTADMENPSVEASPISPLTASHLTDADLTARYVELVTAAQKLRPLISVARDGLSAARRAMEESESYRAWQAVHDRVKGLGTCRALDSEAHVLQLVAKARSLKLPKV